MNSKRGAMELSMSTIVIVVLAMVLLVGGIVLVKNILGGANATVDLTNRNVLGKLNDLFSENEDVVILLGADKKIEIKADGTPGEVAFGARTIDGDGDASEMRYKLGIDKTSIGNCFEILGEEKLLSFFDKRFEEDHIFLMEESDGTVRSKISITIPKGTKKCDQTITVRVSDGADPAGQNYFTLRIK